MKPTILSFLALSLQAVTSAQVELHVAPAGRDDAPGTPTEPLATLVAARDAMRQARAGGATGPYRVWLHGGDYRVTRSIDLTAADSGTAEAPVIYAAAPGERPRLVGGASIPASAWRPANAGRVVVADLPVPGDQIGKLSPLGFGRGGTAPSELFYGGEPMTPARYPNAGWLVIDGLPDGAEGSTLRVAGDRLKRWRRAKDGWLYGYWFHGWADQFLPLTAVDAEARTLTLGARHRYGMRKGQRFFATNLLEELDAPGEYHFDVESGKVYFLPPGDLRDPCWISLLAEPLLATDGASHIRLQGLELAYGRGSGAVVRNGEGIVFADCVFRNLGGDAVVVRDGRHHSVEGCEVAQVGGSGIALLGGDRATLTPSGHRAVDNRIHHFSRLTRTYRPALRLGGVGQLAAHNLIHDAPHMAIGFGGNDHRIEHNEIHHVLLETDDAGAMYIGRDWTARGHVIRFNFLHHCGSRYQPTPPLDVGTGDGVVHAPSGRHGTSLLYLDDAASGVTMYGNVLHGGYRGILLGGGRDNTVECNLFVGGRMGIWLDGRGLGWAKAHIAEGGAWEMYRKLREMRHDQPPYSERYPPLATILEGDPALPVGNRFLHNRFVAVPDPLRVQNVEADIAVREGDRVVEVVLEGAVDELTREGLVELVRRVEASGGRAVEFLGWQLATVGPRGR